MINPLVIQAIKKNSATPEEAEMAIKRYKEENEIYEQRESEYAKQKRTSRYWYNNEREDGTLPCLSYLDDIRNEENKRRKEK